MNDIIVITKMHFFETFKKGDQRIAHYIHFLWLYGGCGRFNALANEDLIFEKIYIDRLAQKEDFEKG